MQKIEKKVRKGKRIYFKLRSRFRCYDSLREIGICPCIEGKILDVVDHPFGIILGDVHLWHALELSQPSQSVTVGITTTEIEGQFVPMSEIARIDFLTGKSQ